MAKLICKRCGKIFSDVSAFCPKCGAPSEISGRPEFIGGRQMAMAGRSVRSRAKGSFDGKLFDEDSFEVEDGLTHSHSSFDDICSDDESPLGKIRNASEKIRASQTSRNARTSRTSESSRSAVSFTFNNLAKSVGSASKRSGKKLTQGKMIGIIIAVIIFINILSMVITGIASVVSNIAYRFDEPIGGNAYAEYAVDQIYYDDEEAFGLTEAGSNFMEIVAAQLEYRNANIDEAAIMNSTDEYKIEFLSTWIDQEISVLQPYIGSDLSDNDDFNCYCNDYVNGLNYQLNALDYYSVDYEEFEDQWTMGYDMCLYSVIDMYEIYGMPLNSELYEMYCIDFDKRVYDSAKPEDIMMAYML